MTNNELIERRVAREILNLIEKIYFSEEYRSYRINYGSNGTRDLILNTIEDRYLDPYRPKYTKLDQSMF